uniref:Specifically androgen-regulated gene protein-like n=1 Tax=Kryptolebias marmoratus TaxID=37003 RepID=A0A3Q2ZCV0_KRYMA
EDNTLQYLSPAEKECLQFFEETIESLEESLEVDNRRPRTGRTAVNHVDGLPVLSSNHRVNVSSHQDIIDLVHQEPAVQNQEPAFNPSSPDFQHMFPTPESHFEVKPIRDSLPSGYDPSLPSGSYGSADGHSSYHPPGCIPTPVLIAQKIAENKGEGTTNLDPSTILRRLSSEKSSNRPNVHVKHSPHSPAKPRRYPANINVIHSSKEPKPVANVDIHERQEQMLSNLPGSSYPLVLDNSLQATDQTEQIQDGGLVQAGPEQEQSPAPATKTNLPDILSSHMDKNQPTAAKLEPQLAELNSYGGKSRSINPTNRSTSKSAKPPPPATAPRPPRSSYQGINTPPKPSPRALSPDHKRKPSSMFRPQGITVQFCGRGAMNESRREALRKLGLLKDS